VVNLQVTEAREWTIQVRALLSARNAGLANDLQADVREKLLAFIRDDMPEALPRLALQGGPAADDAVRPKDFALASRGGRS
jgi:hypothetical protein